MDAKQKKAWIDHLVTARKEFTPLGQGRRAPRHVRLLEEEAQQLLESISTRSRPRSITGQVSDPITGETRAAIALLRSVEEKIKVSDSGKMSFARKWCARPWWPARRARSSSSPVTPHCARLSKQYLFEERATCCDW